MCTFQVIGQLPVLPVNLLVTCGSNVARGGAPNNIQTQPLKSWGLGAPGDSAEVATIRGPFLTEP